MQETKLFNEKRAEIYWWLSSLFAREMNDEELAKYQTAEIRGFIGGLAENSTLNSAATRLIEALNKLQDREDARLELAADFCGLFLTTDKHAALPYASIYHSGLLNGEPTRRMEALLLEKNIAMMEGFKEPADHLAIQLDFLGNLIVQSNEILNEEALEQALLEQKDFIETHLMTWLPQFNENCQKYDDFGFYASVSQLLIDFIQLDCDYIAGE
ncbi:molecular chaperone TorD [Vibrio sp. SCSIO 43132]|uniref:molecular chaperone TorD n=1 Tax=Vibrio sp. SCSIO 43132 TaxID=2779363 RepID=UPI001CA9E20B|nr:molecular chaperone TorD [Vibrio sp. SCSIO 43132]UAB69121.1 molecular chaperone TorD [Vibrio sp. SCSIO 43132]